MDAARITSASRLLIGWRHEIAAIALIVIGVIAFAYGGISYTREKKVLDIGPLQATTKTRETIPLPPVLGIAAIAGGVALLVVAARRR